jgi:hypothetical protein
MIALDARDQLSRMVRLRRVVAVVANGARIVSCMNKLVYCDLEVRCDVTQG